MKPPRSSGSVVWAIDRERKAPMKRTIFLSLVLGTVLVIAPAARAAYMSDGGGGLSVSSAGQVTMAPAEYKALMARSEALNKKYGNAVTALTPAQFSALYNAGGDRLSPQEFNALVARSQGLDRQYGSSGVTLHTDVLGGNGGAATTQLSPTGGDSFAWGDVTIGAVGLTAAILLALATLTVTRRRRVLSF
jgi:hypothetical protein